MNSLRTILIVLFLSLLSFAALGQEKSVSGNNEGPVATYAQAMTEQMKADLNLSGSQIEEVNEANLRFYRERAMIMAADGETMLFTEDKMRALEPVMNTWKQDLQKVLSLSQYQAFQERKIEVWF